MKNKFLYLNSLLHSSLTSLGSESSGNRNMVAPEIARLADTEGFIAAFREAAASDQHRFLAAAYVAVESTRVESLGSRKYKFFQSFKSSIKHFERSREKNIKYITQDVCYKMERRELPEWAKPTSQ